MLLDRLSRVTSTGGSAAGVERRARRLRRRSVAVALRACHVGVVWILWLGEAVGRLVRVRGAWPGGLVCAGARDRLLCVGAEGATSGGVGAARGACARARRSSPAARSPGRVLLMLVPEDSLRPGHNRVELFEVGAGSGPTSLIGALEGDRVRLTGRFGSSTRVAHDVDRLLVRVDGTSTRSGAGRHARCRCGSSRRRRAGPSAPSRGCALAPRCRSRWTTSRIASAARSRASVSATTSGRAASPAAITPSRLATSRPVPTRSVSTSTWAIGGAPGVAASGWRAQIRPREPTGPRRRPARGCRRRRSGWPGPRPPRCPPAAADGAPGRRAA